MIAKSDESDEMTFRRFARSFFKQVATNDWDGAFAQIDLPPHHGEPWTRARFRHVVEVETFGPETRFRRAHPEGVRYSDPDDLEGDGNPSIYNRKGHSTYEFEFSVPLNGEWTDLTACFEFEDAGEFWKVRLDWLNVQ